VLYGNVAALQQESPDGSVKQIDLSDEEIKRLRAWKALERALGFVSPDEAAALGKTVPQSVPVNVVF
jgi:hypothetical protein